MVIDLDAKFKDSIQLHEELINLAKENGQSTELVEKNLAEIKTKYEVWKSEECK